MKPYTSSIEPKGRIVSQEISTTTVNTDIVEPVLDKINPGAPVSLHILHSGQYYVISCPPDATAREITRLLCEFFYAHSLYQNACSSLCSESYKVHYSKLLLRKRKLHIGIHFKAAYEYIYNSQ